MRFKSKAEISHAEINSDSELHDKLWQALNAIEPGFLGVADIKIASKDVIYVVAPDGNVVHYQRSYTDADNKIELGPERTEVEPVTEWKPVNAEAKNNSCRCVTPAASTTPPQSADSASGESVMHKHAERITALIANKNTPWREADRSHLETVGDERLREEEQFAATADERARIAEEERKRKEAEAAGTPASTATGAPVPPQSTAVAAARTSSTPKTGEEDPDAWKTTAPAEVVRVYEAEQARLQQKRADNIKVLKTRLAANKALVAKLDTKSDEEIDDLMAATAQPEKRPLLEGVVGVDFSGKALAGQQQARQDEGDESKVPPAPKVSELIRNQRAGNPNNRGASAS